jgi:hypothetical protein
MSDNGIVRVHYFERQFLRMQDFSDEQAYHLAMRRRHHIGQHSWGIVHGLTIVEEEGNLFVQPGLAIDGYGRELILPQKASISTGAFDKKDSDTLDVWLMYQRLGSDRAPQGYAGCVAKDEDTGDEDIEDETTEDETAETTVPFYRWQETALIRLDVPDPAFPNRRRPESVPIGDLAFDPTRTPPDDPQEDWPVFLGQVKRTRPDPEKPPAHSIDLADRPYAGLVGEAIVAPSGRALVQIGAEKAGDTRRFAVFVPAPTATDTQSQPRLEIDAQGEIDIRGKTTLHGDLELKGGAVEFGISQARSSTTPPWRIYHHVETVPSQGNGDPQEPIEHQLRLEMGGGSGGHNQVVIGSWSEEKGTFQPCLTIDDNRRVIVSGNLVVSGRIIETTARPTVSLSQEARDFGQAALLTGMGGASALLESVYRSPGESDRDVLTRLLDSDEGRVMVAEVLLEDGGRCEALMILVVADSLGQRATLAGLQANSDRFEEFAGLILDDDPGRQAIVDSLDASSSRQETFANKLMDKVSIQQALSRSLLAIHDGQQAIVDSLAASPQLDAVVVLLLEKDEVRQAITVHLLETTDGRQTAAAVLLAEPEGREAIIAFLQDHEGHRTAFSQELTEDPTTRDAVANSLLENQEGRGAIITNLQEHEERRTAFSNELWENETTRHAFIDSMLESLVISLDDGSDEPMSVQDFAAMVKAKSMELANELRNALRP